MSSSESGSLSSGVQYPPDSFHDRFSFSSESRPPTPVDVNAPMNPVFEKRTRKKVDKRLIPVLAVLYATAFVDATNLPVARREGADKDFNLLIGHRYYFVSFVFFLPSIFFQLPLNLAPRRAGMALWLGTVMFLLGALQIASGFVNGWGQFLAIRVVLGVFEAGILPSCVLLISSWYKRSEMQIRVTLFYSVSVFVSSFSNILGVGLSGIHTRGLHGWRWILALEGLMTVLLSFYGYSAVLPFPDRKHTAHAPFLSRDEIQIIRQRIEIDRKDYVPDHLDQNSILRYVVDMNLWAYAVLALCANVAVYASPFLLQASLPSDSLSDAEIQLLFAPIGIAATAIVLLTCFVSTRSRMICPFLTFNFLLSTAGLSMIGFSDSPEVRFVGSFLTYSGAQASVPMILSLVQVINVRRHSKRFFAISLVASFAGIGALLSVLVFPMSTEPDYAPGVRTALALQAAGAVLTVALMARLRYKNRVPEGSRRLGRDRGGGSSNDIQVAGRLDSSYRHGRQEMQGSLEGMIGFQYAV